MTGLHAALSALLDDVPNMVSCSTPADDHEGCYVHNVIVRLRALLAEHPATSNDGIPPGPCWHDSGTTWPSGEHPRCELLAGHAGAHTWKRPGGGEAVWIVTAPADLPVATDSTTAALVERSSFGTPEATALRASVSDEVAARVVARVKELEADAPAPAPEPSDRAGLSESVGAVLAEHRHPGEFLAGLGDAWLHCSCGQRIDLPVVDQAVPIAEAARLFEAHQAEAIELFLADRLAVAEQERAQAMTVSAVRTEQRDRLRDELLPAERARAEAAEQKVAAVEALHGKTHWCFGGDDVNDLRDDKVFEPGTEHWPCPTLVALGDSAQVVQRIKDEAAAAELSKISAELYRDHDMPPRKDSRSYQYRDGWWDGVHHAAKVVEQRARRVRDGEPS